MFYYTPVLVTLVAIASCGAADNTTARWETYDNTTASWENYDKCTNECEDDDSSFWCGERRSNEEGISRCVQFTKTGDPCVSKCQGWKDETYKWCMTNSIRLSNPSNWWDYCSEEGFTINQEKCMDSCLKRDEDYFWCHTVKGWDKCSPPGQVRPMQMTIKGGLCKSNCSQHENTYYWCTRSLSFCRKVREEDGKCDDYWEYCSPDSTSTINRKQCKDECAQRGKPYYWCNDMEGAWDYCSPNPEESLTVNTEFTIYGEVCKTYCGTHGQDYNWCKQISDSSDSWWDYCSLANQTINSEPCSDSCTKKGQNYFWCHTEDTWDYCCPNKDTVNVAVCAISGSMPLVFMVFWCIKALQ